MGDFVMIVSNGRLCDDDLRWEIFMCCMMRSGLMRCGRVWPKVLGLGDNPVPLEFISG